MERSSRGSFSLTPMPASFGSIEESLLAALSSTATSPAARREAIVEAAKTADPVELIEMVSDHTNASRRNAAIEALTQAGPRGVATVVRALQHEDPEVIMFAAGILGRSRDPSVVPHLVGLLAHSDVNIVQSSIESLAALRSPQAVVPLIELLGADLWIAFSAIHALGEIGDARAALPLATLLDREEYEQAVMEALGRIGTPEATAYLAGKLRDAASFDSFANGLLALGLALEQLSGDDPMAGIPTWLRLHSADAAPLHERLYRILASDDPEERNAAGPQLRVAAAELVCAARLEPLYGALIEAGRDPSLEDLLLFCATTVGPTMGPAIGLGLKAPNTSVRLLACRAAGVLALKTLSPLVTRLLDDADELVRASAVRTLARLRDDWSAPAIVDLLGDPTDVVREAAIEALSRMDSESVTSALITRRTMDTSQLRAALDVMRRSPHASQRPFIEQALADVDAEVRRAAISSLVAQHPNDLLDLLEPLRDDPDIGVRREIASAIGLSRDARARDLLLAQITRDPATRTQVVQALGDVGDASVVPQLVELFETETLLTRLAIIDALGELKDGGAEPSFIRWMADPEPEVRRASVQALGRCATPAARRRVVAATRDSAWQVRAAAAALLVDSPSDTWAIPALERLCHDENEYVAELAKKRLDHVALTRITVQAPAP